MGQHPAADSDSPQVVVVEVTASGGRGGGGIPRRPVVVGLAAMVVIAAIAVVWLGAGRGRPSDPVAAPGPNGVAAAYGYPLGCLSVTILATYARADLSHAVGCGHLTGYAPAIFHYVAGRWRLVPDAIGYMCFSGAVPAEVEQGLDLCVGSIGRGCARIGIPGQGRPAPELGWPCAKLPKIAGVV